MQYSLFVGSGNFITNNILTNVIDFAAPIVGIALIIFCVLQAFQIFKGSDTASVKKMVNGVIILLFLLGIMYAAGSFEVYGRAFQHITNNIIDKGAKDAGKIVG